MFSKINTYFSKLRNKFFIFLLLIFIFSNIFFFFVIAQEKEDNLKNELYFEIEEIKNNSNKFEFDYISDMLRNIIKDSLENKEFLFKDEFSNLFENFLLNIIQNLNFNDKSDIELFQNIDIDFFFKKEVPFILKYLNNSEKNRKNIFAFISINVDYNILNLKEIEKLKDKDNILELFYIDFENNLELNSKNNVNIFELIKKERLLFIKLKVNYLNDKYEKSIFFLIPFDYIKIYDYLINLANYYFVKEITGIKYYKLFIKSSENYLIKINNSVIGKTNNLLFIKEGKYTLEIFGEEYKSYIEEIDLKNDYYKEIELEKVNKKSKISIYVYPESSNVFINNTYIGKSPIIDYNIDNGLVFIHINNNKFQNYQMSFIINEDESKIIRIFLKPLNTTNYFLDYSNKYLQKSKNLFKISGLFFLSSLISFSIGNNFYEKHLTFGNMSDYYNYLIFLNIGYLLLFPTFYFLIDFYYNLYLYSEIYKNYLFS